MREQSWQNEVMRWETDHVRRLPLGGKLSPQVTDEGATLYPTQQKNQRRSSAPSTRLPRSIGTLGAKPCSIGTLGTGSPPHPTRLTPAHLPPK